MPNQMAKDRNGIIGAIIRACDVFKTVSNAEVKVKAKYIATFPILGVTKQIQRMSSFDS